MASTRNPPRLANDYVASIIDGARHLQELVIAAPKVVTDNLTDLKAIDDLIRSVADRLSVEAGIDWNA